MSSRYTRILGLAAALGGCGAAELPYDVPEPVEITFEDVRSLLSHPRKNLPRLRELAEKNNPELRVLSAVHQAALRDEAVYRSLLSGVPGALDAITIRGGRPEAGPGVLAALLRPLVNVFTGERETDLDLLERQHETKRLEVLGRLEALVGDVEAARERVAREEEWLAEAEAEWLVLRHLAEHAVLRRGDERLLNAREHFEDVSRRATSTRDREREAELGILMLVGAEP